MAGISHHPLSAREQTAGLVYTVFSLFFLPILLPAANSWLAKPLGNVWINFIYYCLNILCLSALLRGFLRKHLVYAGKHIWKVLGWCLLGFAIYYVSTGILSFFIKKLVPGFSNVNDDNIAQQFSENYWVMAIGTILLVPTAEELMHRALIFGSLKKSYPKAAYPVSMVFFAAVHVMSYVGVQPPLYLALAFLQYLPAGWVLAWCYKKSGCIFVPILIHTIVNITGLFALR